MQKFFRLCLYLYPLQKFDCQHNEYLEIQRKDKLSKVFIHRKILMKFVLVTHKIHYCEEINERCKTYIATRTRSTY